MKEPDAAPDLLAGRRVRCTAVRVTPALTIEVLEAADADVVIEEAIAGEGDAYAAILWPSAIAVASTLAGIGTAGCTVLDLGAGTGLVALTAARLGARAIAADHDPFARQVIEFSARRLGLDVQVVDFDIAGDAPLPTADIVVMADLLYQPELARAAAHRALEAIAAGSRVLIGDPARYGRTELERILEAAGVAIRFDDALAHVPGDATPTRVGIALLP